MLHGAQLEAEVKRNASGRPGPNVVTGNYRRSINRRTTRQGTTITTRVSSAQDHARRLEMGFTGTDSLGRSYDQKALPHFGPALDSVAPRLQAALQAVMAGGKP